MINKELISLIVVINHSPFSLYEWKKHSLYIFQAAITLYCMYLVLKTGRGSPNSVLRHQCKKSIKKSERFLKARTPLKIYGYEIQFDIK